VVVRLRSYTKIGRISKGVHPLKAYEDLHAFKVYHLDIGLMRVMSGLSPKIITETTHIFEEFKGALTEQYVLQTSQPRTSHQYITGHQKRPLRWISCFQKELTSFLLK